MKKTFLITGAASGLGRALTSTLFALGHECILIDKDLKNLNRLYDELHENTEDTGLLALYPMDFLGANIDHYQELGKTLTDNFDGLDGVFLNAAILPAFAPVANFDHQQWYEVLHTNLNANFHLIQQTIRPLLKKNDSHLVAISDVSVFQKPAFYGAYGVAKAGLEQLMTSLAKEHIQSSLHFSIARLGAFATESRGRLFPGENPKDLPSAEAVAHTLLNQLNIICDLPESDSSGQKDYEWIRL